LLISEQTYFALASILVFEVLIVGLPVMIAVNDSPAATFIVLTGIIALDDIGILCFLFVPKFMYQLKGLEEGVGVGESILKKSHRQASNREFIRRENSARFSGSFSDPRAITNNESNFGSVSGSGKHITELGRPSGQPSQTVSASIPQIGLVAEVFLGESIAEETSEQLRDDDDGNENDSRLHMFYKDEESPDQAPLPRQRPDLELKEEREYEGRIPAQEVAGTRVGMSSGRDSNSRDREDGPPATDTDRNIGETETYSNLSDGSLKTGEKGPNSPDQVEVI
jgi:hypothetical protein